MRNSTPVPGTMILTLVLGSSACLTNPDDWTEPEPAQASPAEIAMLSGRVADTWSLIEYEESNHNKTICYDPVVDISILLANDSIWVGISTGDRRQIRRIQSGYDWMSLAEILQRYRDMPVFAGPPVRRDIQLAAADPVRYEDVLNAMDHAIAMGFTDFSYVLPRYLNVNFTGL